MSGQPLQLRKIHFCFRVNEFFLSKKSWYVTHSTHTPKVHALPLSPSLPGVSALFLFTVCPLAGAAAGAELELHFAAMLNFSSKDSFTSAASCSRSSANRHKRRWAVSAGRPQRQQAAPKMKRLMTNVEILCLCCENFLCKESKMFSKENMWLTFMLLIKCCESRSYSD